MASPEPISLFLALSSKTTCNATRLLTFTAGEIGPIDIEIKSGDDNARAEFVDFYKLPVNSEVAKCLRSEKVEASLGFKETEAETAYSVGNLCIWTMTRGHTETCWYAPEIEISLGQEEPEVVQLAGELESVDGFQLILETSHECSLFKSSDAGTRSPLYFSARSPTRGLLLSELLPSVPGMSTNRNMTALYQFDLCWPLKRSDLSELIFDVCVKGEDTWIPKNIAVLAIERNVDRRSILPIAGRIDCSELKLNSHETERVVLDTWLKQ